MRDRGPKRDGNQRQKSAEMKAEGAGEGGGATVGPSRARARKRQGGRELTVREQRVERVLDLMCRGQWLTGVTDKLLAKEWGVTPDHARKISAEASRALRLRVRDDPEGQKEARAQILQIFDVIRTKAMAAGDAQNLRVALDATRAFGFYMGIEPVKRLELNDRRGETPIDQWTLEEKLAFASTGKRPERKTLRSLNGSGESMH